MAIEDWYDLKKGPAKGILASHLIFVIGSYFIYVVLAWGTFRPTFMFYQHYFSALASGFYCLVLSSQMPVLSFIQLILGVFAFLCNCFYLGEAMGGSWTGNFEGENTYPRSAFEPKKFDITAENLTEYSFAYALYVTDIGWTWGVMFLQNIVLNIILPGILFSGTFQSASCESKWDCNQRMGSLIAHVTIGGVIAAIGVFQGFLSFVFIGNGIILLNLSPNLMYMLYFMVVAGLVPPPKVSKNDNGDYVNEAEEISTRKPGCYNYTYLVFYGIVWVVTYFNVVFTANWSQFNNLGGFLCTSFENVTEVMSGERSLYFDDQEVITYTNLTGEVSQSGYPNRVRMTQDNIQAIFDFSCIDLWLNWIVLALSLVMFLLQIFIVRPHGG